MSTETHVLIQGRMLLGFELVFDVARVDVGPQSSWPSVDSQHVCLQGATSPHLTTAH